MMVKSTHKVHIFIFTFVLLTSSLIAQGYEIKLKVPDFAGKEVILAEYFATRMVPKDTAQVNLTGEAVFKKQVPLDGGMYVMYFGAQYYFDFLLNDDQVFSIEADSSDFINKVQFKGSLDNELFYSYKQFLSIQREQQEQLKQQLADAKNSADSASLRKKMDDLNDKTTGKVEEMISKNSETFFSTFLLSMKEHEAPEEILQGTKREQDSIRYVYYKDHYFDTFDPSDLRLLHTPLYEPKIKTYINKVVPQHPDSLIAAVDMLIEKSRADEAIFRYMLITLFNNFAESKMMGMDKVYFHIAEKYYIPEATWSSEEFLSKLRENLEKSKPTFIGNTAPDFELKGLPVDHFHLAEMDTAIKRDPHVGFNFMLSDIPAEYTILYFWEADCGHCKKSTPKLYEVFEKYKDQGLQVLAIHVINSVEGKETWIDFVNEHQLYDWINCWSPYDNEFRRQYNLQSFPQLFLLDKDKKIIAKQLTPEQADDILNRFINNTSN